MQRTFRMGVLVVGLCVASGCGSDDDDGSGGTGGSSSGGTASGGTSSGGTSSGGTSSGGTSSGGTAGAGGATGGTAGAAGNQTGGAAGGGTGGAGDGYFLEFDATIAGKNVKNKCTPNSDPLGAQTLAMVKPGLQFNIGCPGATGVALQNGHCYVVIKNIDSLPSGAYSFKAGDGGYEAQCGQPSADGGMLLVHTFAKTLTLSGNWDSTTREIDGDLSGTWEDGGSSKPAGTATIKFKGKVP